MKGKTGGLKVWVEKKIFKEIMKAYKYLKTHGLSDIAGLTARGVRKLPKTAQFNAQRESLKMEKTAIYSDYKALRAELKELQIVRRNLEEFFSSSEIPKGIKKAEKKVVL